jgi:hypothetical protein
VPSFPLTHKEGHKELCGKKPRGIIIIIITADYAQISSSTVPFISISPTTKSSVHSIFLANVQENKDEAIGPHSQANIKMQSGKKTEANGKDKVKNDQVSWGDNLPSPKPKYFNFYCPSFRGFKHFSNKI